MWSYVLANSTDGNFKATQGGKGTLGLETVSPAFQSKLPVGPRAGLLEK